MPDHRPAAQPAAQPVALQRRETVIGHGIAWTARWSARWVLIALGAVLLGLVVQQVWVVLLPIALALILTTVLQPPSRWLERRLRFPAALAAATTLIGSLAALVGIGFLLAPSVSGQAEDIVEDAGAGLQQLQDWVQTKEFVSADQIDAGIEAVQDRLSDSGGQIASGVLTGVGAATSVITTLVICLILTFLFLKDGRRFLPWLRRLSGPRVGGHLDEVLSRSWTTLGGYIRTQAIVSLVDAVIIGAGLLLVGVPLAVPLAVLTFFAGFIPIVGAFVAGTVAVLVALVSGGTTDALIILVVIIGVQQLEGNVLSPWLQAKSMNLHAAVVLLSVTLGGTLFGIIGAFLAVPVAAVAAVVLRYLDEQVTLRSAPLPAAGTDDGEEGADDERERSAEPAGKPAED
ncbi:AI-2E family transporter [Nocardioides lijunqiniae]|uniref:AI-2E family transporter n=1 Tax=Nocardioides lijunqiniae TaxID=2760832 RepID=UPI001877AC9C|nr:AI-2E family transporter [Nocardioides lijunqiniae]